MKSSIADNRSAKSLALLGAALGAAALGAVAVGAVAIGYMAIGRLAIGRLRIGVLEVDELKVRSLTVPTTAGMQPSGPMGGSAKGKGRTSQPTEATPFIRRAASADSDETAAMFSRALRSMSFFPKLHSDEEDRAFVRCSSRTMKHGSRFAKDALWASPLSRAVSWRICTSIRRTAASE